MTRTFTNYTSSFKNAPNPVKIDNKWRRCTSLKCRTSRQLCETKLGHAQHDRQTKKKHKNSYFRSRVAARKPISTKRGMWIKDVRAIFSVDNCFGIRPLVFGLGAPEILGRNDVRRVDFLVINPWFMNRISLNECGDYSCTKTCGAKRLGGGFRPEIHKYGPIGSNLTGPAAHG